MELKPLKVGEVNQYIKRLLVSDPILYNINVEGEISNFKHHYSGHMYFTLKDDNSRLRCVMFNGDTNSLNFEPKDGMQVKVKGYISVYERDGSYQLYAKKMEGKGIGELYAAFEELKKKLHKEGLFDDKYKKKIPYIPKKIGVVTSSTGAAVRDILTVIHRRFPSVDISIYPVLVQGDKAPTEICKGLEYFNTRDDIDVIITGRGGGSIEELWAFNEEIVARSIFTSKIPIISAVGHETDFTIADFVADLRAPTPSAAGELATPIYDELKSKLDDNIIRLEVTYRNLLKEKRNQLELCRNNIVSQSPLHKLRENKERLKILLKDLIRGVNLKHNDSKNKLENIVGRLNALSPLSTLDRGYSIAMNEDKRVINSIDDVTNDDTIKILLKDGELTSVVKNIDKGHK